MKHLLVKMLLPSGAILVRPRPRDDYEYPTTRRQRQLQQNNRFNKQNNNFARASRFYFCISLPFLHDYDVKMPNFAFYG